ncbi:MAG: hypothetical protein V4757_06755 [Pseudomonadota bacterium]
MTDPFIHALKEKAFINDIIALETLITEVKDARATVANHIQVAILSGASLSVLREKYEMKDASLNQYLEERKQLIDKAHAAGHDPGALWARAAKAMHSEEQP